MKLYIMPGACSMVPHVALEWTKEDYELEILDHDSVKLDAYLRINPQGSVPAIVDGDTIVTQNIAVQTYIDAKYPDADIFGANESPAQRAEIMQWLAFINSDVHKSFAPLFGPDGFVTDETAKADLKETAKQKIVSLLEYPNRQLATRDYLTGTKTTADIYLYVILTWAKKMELDLSSYKNFNAFISRIESDAGVTEVIRQEGISKIESL